MTRVWGGRALEHAYGRELPDESPYGESWEIVDRRDEQSVVKGGTLAGTFALALDTRATGGSLQYTGRVEEKKT